MPEIHTISLSACKGIHMLGGVGSDSNIYLVDEEIIIDTGTGSFFGDVKNEIEKLCNHKSIKAIINTHYHFDHTGGNKKFRDWLKAELLIHEADKERIENGETMSEVFGERSRIVTVDRALKHGNVIRTKNFRLHVISTPGHTPGSICIYEPDKKILFSGDTLFESGIGRTDFSDSSKPEMLSSLRRLLNYPAEYLFPGHGAPKVRGVDFLIKQTLSLEHKAGYF